MYLVFDIGASKIRLARSSDGKSFDEPQILPTPTEPEALIALVKKEVDALLAGEEPQAVCGGLTRKLQSAAEGLRRLFACPVYLENDTALVGLGEAAAGAGRGVSILAYITISSGVGGVRIVDRKIDRYAVGFEPGQQVINFLEPERAWEQYISGAAAKRETGKEPQEITEPAFWEEKARLTAFGVYNTILHWSPELVVLGGGMMKKPGISLEAIRGHLERIKTILPGLPPLEGAALGDFGGLHGALHFLSQL